MEGFEVNKSGYIVMVWLRILQISDTIYNLLQLASICQTNVKTLPGWRDWKKGQERSMTPACSILHKNTFFLPYVRVRHRQ